MRGLAVGLTIASLVMSVAPGARAASSCYDGAQNGPESDVDCGGDCPLCAVGSACRVARDCASGLCNASVCEERSWSPGTPIPSGYHVEQSRHDRAATARVGGAWFLGVGYASAYVSALALPNQLSAMYVPLAGPWLSLRRAEPGWPKTLLIANGVVQDVGAVLLIGGLIGAGQQLLREREAPNARLDVVPALGARGGSVTVIGVF
ncbi:MAG: hypothetical protein OZ921_14525 [Sorangiineae bacterium]|nr:hypothetical protein [Polyangiaceae bacterium]MEB2323723.1 hypothetical protein [Sorangiineae bacterium]